VPEAPQGTISFLFTDIVGSSRLWEKFPQRMGAALARHDELIRAATEEHDGYVFKTVGDSFCVAFCTPQQALLAAIAAQQAIASEDWSAVGSLIVRMGIHTGVAEFRGGDYFGGTLNRAARIEAAAHGAQILLSQVTVDLLEDEHFATAVFKSLGNHRLRNLDRPEHLFQAVVAGLRDIFPPPRSMEILPNNLPVQSTSFIGRDREMEAIRHLMERTSLLTLIGTGGTGKTRLALEAGARMINEFPAGVWLIEFAPISDPTRIVEVVTMVLDIREEPDQPLKTTLLNSLRDRELLLIFDNCEHLLAATSSLAAELLRTCPRLKILATSRHSLGLAGEQTFPVPPLGMLDMRIQEQHGPIVAETLSQYDAVKLFIERATAVRPDFRVTNANAPALAEVCSRLDGIPLAIELAAARVRVLSLNQIAMRLNDRFHFLRGGSRNALPHQQTLQALIDWSHDLLSDQERIVFRRLGAFVGGRTLAALETVCAGDGVEDYDILDLVQQLVDKSLVTVERDTTGEPRYTMIESVWQYAKEKLESSGEEQAIRQRHMEYFLAWAEKAEPYFEGPDQKVWLDRGFNETLNFRGAAEWALSTGNIEAGLRFVSALHRMIEVRGNASRALELVRKLFAHVDDSISPKILADACVSAGRLAWAVDDYIEARQYHARARSLYDSIHDEKGSALCSLLTAFLDRGDRDPVSADKNFRRALEISERIGHLYVQAACESGLGSLALDRGDLEEARRMKEESLVHYERLGDQWVIGLILWGIAKVSIAQGDLERTRSSLDQWLQIAHELGNRWSLPYILDCYGELALLRNDAPRAARILGAAQGMRNASGARFSDGEKDDYDALLGRLKKALSEEEFKKMWDEGLASPWIVSEEALA
jgi:predicted ATPase/class 3 adenylate cyclase